MSTTTEPINTNCVGVGPFLSIENPVLLAVLTAVFIALFAVFIAVFVAVTNVLAAFDKIPEFFPVLPENKEAAGAGDRKVFISST
jgi:uncharacterized membrane protein (DUF106 family)